MNLFPTNACNRQKNVIKQLHSLINTPVAVRLGETAVVSTKVHMQNVEKPQEIIAIMNADAGKVFYHRNSDDEVIHIDVFHSEGNIKPEQLATAIINRISFLTLENSTDLPNPNIQLLMPYIDIQTSLGGGRIDGTLEYGKKESVKLAHINHVHLTMLNISPLIACIFTIIDCVETIIEKSGLELRKICNVVMDNGNSPMDLTDYMTTSDSFLKQQNENNQTNTSSTELCYKTEAIAKQTAKDIGSTSDTLKLLENLTAGMHPTKLMRFRGPKFKDLDEIRLALERSNLIQLQGRHYKLTPLGEITLDYLRRHSVEIEAYLRRLLWSLPANPTQSIKSTSSKLKSGKSGSRGYALPKLPGDTTGNLAIIESIMAKGTTPGPLTPKDLRFLYTRVRNSKPIVLLLDASASMSGKRISAAKQFAQHLIVTAKDQICVVIFQDTNVKVVCDFTKNPRKLEASLKSIKPQGLTPLAKGFIKISELCRNKINKPLVLCVTDGIPTVAYHTLSPIEDAITTAQNLSRQGVHISCIGLEPNRRFLERMIREVGGSLYIIDELEASKIASIAQIEQKERL